jgi:hypothetical protein
VAVHGSITRSQKGATSPEIDREMRARAVNARAFSFPEQLGASAGA